MVCCSNVHKALLVFSWCILNSFIEHKSPMGIQKNGISTYASIFFPKFLQSFFFPLGITQKIKIKINKPNFILCNGIKPRHFQHNGLSTSNLGGILFRPKPWALPYIECVILELVSFLFNAHLFIFFWFLVCVISRAK